MNKSNKILLGVLSFVVVCVVGYALFSDSITVTGTATASGSFDILATCQTGLSNDTLSILAPGENVNADIDQAGYKNDSCEVINEDVKIAVEFEYPTARRYFTINFKNNGTIAASFDLQNGIVDSTTACSKDYNAAENCTPLTGDYAIFNDFYQADMLGIKTSSGKILTSEDEDWSNYVSDEGVVTLNPNDTMIFFLEMHWSSEDEGNNKEYLKTHLDLDFNFSQASN